VKEGVNYYNNEAVPGLGKLSGDDEPGWVMRKISKTLPHRMKRFQQKQLKLDELMGPGWGDVADYFWEGDMECGQPE